MVGIIVEIEADRTRSSIKEPVEPSSEVLQLNAFVLKKVLIPVFVFCHIFVILCFVIVICSFSRVQVSRIKTAGHPDEAFFDPIFTA